MQANKPPAETLPTSKRIPPRALRPRADTPVDTVWVPRWKWAARIFGREVRLPATPGGSRALGTVAVSREGEGSSSTEVAESARLEFEALAERQREQAAEIERLRAALAEPQQGRIAAKEQAAVLAANRKTSEVRSGQNAPPDKPAKEGTTPVEDREPWGTWAMPLLVLLAVLVCAYALGATFGYLLAIGHPPYWIAGGWAGALLRAPAGALLLLIASMACFVQARDDRGTRRIWQVSGGVLLGLSLLATFGGLL